MTNIKAIALQFENKTLPKEHWTHAAHIAVAFVQLEKHKNFESTLSSLRTCIKAYNNSVGTENTDNSGYHETLTAFWLKVVAEFYASNYQSNIDQVYQSFAKTILASSKFPLNFYSNELLFSTEARQFWVEPDLLPISEINRFM